MRRFYLIAAIVLSLATSVDVLVAVQSGGLPDHDVLQCYQMILSLLVVAWLVLDPGLPRDLRPTFDHALLLMIWFPLLALYHQFASHRWKGVAVVFGLSALLILPWLFWIVAYALS